MPCISVSREVRAPPCQWICIKIAPEGIDSVDGLGVVQSCWNSFWWTKRYALLSLMCKGRNLEFEMKAWTAPYW